MPPLSRREVLQATTVLLGGAVLAAGVTITGCTGERRPRSPESGHRLSPDDQRLMEEIADTLLPTTPSSPGAKAAGAGPAIALLLADCYDATAQQRMVDGLAALRTLCRDRCGGDFTRLSPGERERLLVEVDAEAMRADETHWFRLARELSLRAYFSTEVGLTKALRYIRVPGRWTGCVPLEPGQPAWG